MSCSPKIILVLFLFAALSTEMVSPRPAMAQAVPTAQVLDTSPTSISRTKDSLAQWLKSFTLDHLASLAAKQILHQMTVATINWINSGFNGSPAFLTNPEGFFLDTADQITGAMIAESGPLRNLCSPWNVDIRLSLALLQTQPLAQRYTCTLGTVINNARNAAVNGHSIRGFVNGDFSQGGWPAFISLTTEPQNNPYGAYLEVHSNILSAIGVKSGTIGQDLLQGHGFLSWPSCKDVQVSTPNVFGSASVLGGSGSAGGNSESTTQTVQQCEIQTPGSVIENSLAEHLGTGVRELELANDINSVVNALVSQLVSQMLTKGLHSLSSGGSGLSGNGLSSLNSYVSQLQSDATAQKSVPNVAASGLGSSSSIESTYDQAISLIIDSKNRYETARSCFANKGGGSGNEAAVIDNIILTTVDPVLTALTAKRVSIASMPQGPATLSVSATTNISQMVESSIQTVNDAVSQGQNSSDEAATASADLSTAQTQAQTFDQDAARYQSECDSLP